MSSKTKRSATGIPDNARAQVLDWEMFYEKVVRYNTDGINWNIPRSKKGFDQLILVPKGLSIARIIEVSAPRYLTKVDFSNRLRDIRHLSDDRDTQTSYGIWIRPGLAPERKHDGRSAEACHQKGIKGITLLERLLIGFHQHWYTGDHMDANTMTLCSGSRYETGQVPTVCWDGGNVVRVSYFGHYEAEKGIGIREVIA